MKKYALIVFILTSLGCRAQTISLTDYSENYFTKRTRTPNGTYIKDENGYLDQFVGVWKAQIGENEVVLYINKGTRTSKRDIKRDLLYLTYSIKPVDGPESLLYLEDTRGISEDDPLMVFGLHPASNGTYQLFYQGRDSSCGQTGYLFLKPIVGSEDSFKLYLKRYSQTIYEDLCPNGSVQPIFPLTETTFTRQ